MNRHLRIVGAVLRKDVLSLWPMIALTVALLVLGVVFDNYELSTSITAYVQFSIWLITAALTTAVIQHDTMVSTTHDWLTRPISRVHLLAAKGAFIGLAVFVPLFLTRAVIYLIEGYSIPEAGLAAANVSSFVLIFGLPFVIAAAAITPTLLQATAALVGAFIAVFVLITFAGQAGHAIDETIMYSGSAWVIVLTLILVVTVMLAVVLWLQYGRGRTALARAVFAVASFVPLAGSMLASANGILAVQQSFAPETPPQDFSLALNPGCFLAESIDVSAGATPDAGVQHSRFMGRGLWDEDVLARVGRGAVAYSTAFSTHGVPKGWRLMVAYSAATYTDEHGNVLERPLPARPTGASQLRLDGGTSSTSYWLLPRTAADRLGHEPTARLAIDYALSLLAPHTVEIDVDRGWQTLPYVGYCSARHNASTATVNVDCMKRGEQPALISAKFAGALAVAYSGPPNYPPSWLVPLTGQRYKLALQVPAGADRSRVTLTAYDVRALFKRTVETAGVLGAPVAECQLPPVDARASEQLQSLWRDSSPHKTSFVGVDEGVRLEVLDWGGSGRPLVLLAGLGDSAHVFDDMAPKLAQKYHVYGISRRGHGASTFAESGYTVPRLTEDVVRVLDALKLDAPVIAGSSIAGEELSELGARYSGRVAGLVYLDAAADRTREMSSEQRANERMLPPVPPPQARELESYAGFVEYLDRLDAARYPEGEVLSIFAFGPDGRIAGRRMDPRVPGAILDAVQKPDYGAFRVPSLALYAMPRGVEDHWRPWYDRSNATIARAVERQYQFNVRARRAMERMFEEGVAGGRVLEVPGAKHHIWLSHEADVVAALDAFIAHLPQ